ncbi:MAG: hypothetical protein ACOYL6_05510 [Bacteriovoracaceae bacterium]
MLFFLIGCGQTYNSNTFDKAVFSNAVIDVSTPAGVRLKAAYDVMEKRCMTCHTHSGWSAFVTSTQWTSADLINPGDSANSAIIYRLNNNGGDMPTTGYILTQDELSAITTWISQL